MSRRPKIRQLHPGPERPRSQIWAFSVEGRLVQTARHVPTCGDAWCFQSSRVDTATSTEACCSRRSLLTADNGHVDLGIDIVTHSHERTGSGVSVLDDIRSSAEGAHGS